METQSNPTIPKVLIAANLALLVLFPIAWFAPLAKAGLLPFFKLKELTIVNSIEKLLEADIFLAALVIFLALIAPLVKTLALAAVQFRAINDKSLPILEVLGKIAMADVFLIAVYIVVAKGVGVGRIETAWGLYLFTFCVLSSMALTHFTKKYL